MKKILHSIKTTVIGGQMIIVPQIAMTMVDASLTDMFIAISPMGIETNNLYKPVSQP